MDEREDPKQTRQMAELLGEMRVALPGVHVLFAFLLTVAFTERFAQATHLQRATYFVVLLATTSATAFFVAPAAAHRLRFHKRDRAFLIEYASRMMIAGLALMAVAVVGAVALVADVLYGGAVALVVSSLVALLVVGLWFGVPIARGFAKHGRGARADREPGGRMEDDDDGPG